MRYCTPALSTGVLFLLLFLFCVHTLLFWPAEHKMGSHVVGPLINPLEPKHTDRLHHPVFQHFYQWRGALNPTHVTDWLGIETPYAWDCLTNSSATMQYADVQPARRIPCDRHVANVATGVEEIVGELPVVDDEYEELVDVLLSVVHTLHDYVIVELGARYGTWGVRALAAWHQLRGPDARATFVGVESDQQFYEWMHEHVTHNGVSHESILLHQFAQKGPGTHLLAIVNASGVDHINYLDADIQGAELAFFEHDPTLTWMDEHVNVVHIGTHSGAIHTRLDTMFQQRGWTRFFGYPLGYGKDCDSTVVNALQTDRACMTNTPYGLVYVRDGMLSFGNPYL